MSKKIFICGESGSGKDTFAKLYKIAKYYNDYPENETLDNLEDQMKHIDSFSDVKSFAFADSLKQMYSLFTQVPLNYLYTDGLKDQYRDGLIEFADAIRVLNNNFAVDDIKAKIDKCKNHDHILITDLRLSHEYDFAKEQDALIIQILKPGLKKKNSHETETYIDKIKPDMIIINDGTLAEFYEVIKGLIN
jgi:hypothetical protein